jgi:serine/threonine protein kinase
MDRAVAIKVIRLGFSLDEAKRRVFLERFHREAQIAGKLGHPHIVAVHDFGAGDEPYIVMEYFPGVSLSTLSERGPLPLGEVELIARQLTVALAYAHARGVVHRDVKPANVLYQAGCVKLLDFGIAKLETSELTATGEFMGTPSYMSPEIFSGSVADGRSDLFSLGVVIYQILTGSKPFEGGNVSRTIYRVLHEEPPPPSSLRAGIPPGWDRVLGKLLAKIPDERYPTAGELLTDLDRLGEGDSGPAHTKTSRSRIALAGGVLLLLAGLVSFQSLRPAVPGLEEPPGALPLRFVARHEHRVGHCTGDLSLAASGILFESPRHDDWHWRPEDIEDMTQRGDSEVEVRVREAGEIRTYRFTFLRPALADEELRRYRETVLSATREKE